MDYRKCQTTTATPPEAGDLPLPLAFSFQPSAISFQLGCGGVEGRGGFPGLKIETEGTRPSFLTPESVI
jgi:hypothetical protein